MAGILGALVSWLYFFHLSGYGGEMVVGPELYLLQFALGFRLLPLCPFRFSRSPPQMKRSVSFFQKLKNCEIEETIFIELS